MRIPLEDVALVVKEMATDKLTWKEVMIKYPKFEQQEAKFK